MIVNRNSRFEIRWGVNFLRGSFCMDTTVSKQSVARGFSSTETTEPNYRKNRKKIEQVPKVPKQNLKVLTSRI